MGVGKITLIRMERKHQVLRTAGFVIPGAAFARLPGDPALRGNCREPRLMAALGGIEQVRDCAENDDDAGAQEREYRDQNNRDHGQDQSVFDQRLPLLAASVPGKRDEKGFDDGGHEEKITGIIKKKLHQRNGFDNARDTE
jgi:hypothetical protein